MSKFTDQNYLKEEQYRDGRNLNARIALHARFSVNKYGWNRWVFDQLEMPEEGRFLELGCGPALFWRVNAARIPSGWDVTLSDFSPGMLEEARQNLAGASHSFNFEIVDAQSIPFPEATFDAVMANHMLYHIPDRDKALQEIRRVLKPGGTFYTATNGPSHMRELFQLEGRATRNYNENISFNLGNGEAELSRYFADVTLRLYEDHLEVTEVEPLVAYVTSSSSQNPLYLEEFRRKAEAEISAKGFFKITKETGLFLAR